MLQLNLGTRRKVHNVSLIVYWIICFSTWPSRVEINEILKICVLVEGVVVSTVQHWESSYQIEKWIWMFVQTFTNKPPQTHVTLKLLRQPFDSTGWIIRITSHQCALYPQRATLICVYLYLTAKPLHRLYCYLFQKQIAKMLLTLHKWESHGV